MRRLLLKLGTSGRGVRGSDVNPWASCANRVKETCSEVYNRKTKRVVWSGRTSVAAVVARKCNERCGPGERDLFATRPLVISDELARQIGNRALQKIRQATLESLDERVLAMPEYCDYPGESPATIFAEELLRLRAESILV